ncbi:MAG: hypothetical protein ACR2QZ_05565 [Woeseiaceae bacterium]
MSLAAAADFDGSKPLLCASMELQECVPGVGCERVTADNINAAEFFRIDVKKKTIVVSARNQERPPQRIEASTKTDDLLVIQGSDDGVEGVRDDGLAYSFAIDKISGKMVLTASGDEVAFVVFGSCTVI